MLPCSSNFVWSHLCYMQTMFFLKKLFLVILVSGSNQNKNTLLIQQVLIMMFTLYNESYLFSPQGMAYWCILHNNQQDEERVPEELKLFFFGSLKTKLEPTAHTV